MRVSDTPLFTGAEMPNTGLVMVSLPISATEFRVHRIARDLIGATGPQGPIGPTGSTGSIGPAGPAGTGGVFLDEAANLVFAGPASGAAAAPAFRALVGGDMPLNYFVRNAVEITGLTGGGASNLDGIVTVGVLVGKMVMVTLPGVSYFYQLIASAIAELVPVTVRADDFAGGTNEKVWVLVGLAAPSLLLDSGFSLYSGPVIFSQTGITRSRLGTGLDGVTGNINFERYNAAGVFQDIPFVIESTTGHTILSGGLTTPRVVFNQSALAYAATTDIDFNLAACRALTLTGNVTFTTSNRSAGTTVKSASIKILCDATSRTFTFPAWKFQGTVPTGIAANKTARLSIESWGATEADCVAAYAVEA